MLLVYTQKVTPRITYVFKHIFTRILGVDISFTTGIEAFIAHKGPKLSYGKKALGSEFFVMSAGLLQEQGFESIEITVKPWEETKCFFSASETSAIPFDVFSASFFLLSRYEEYLPHLKDEYGRYPANESLGYKERFLHDPVIDIWAYKLKRVLVAAYPTIIFTPLGMKTHHLVHAGKPYKYIQQGFVRTSVGLASDLFKFKLRSFFKRIRTLATPSTDPNNTFNWIIENSKNTKSTVFFLIGEATDYIHSISTHRKKFKLLVKYISDYKKVGLVFSMDALNSLELLKKEKQQLEAITNKQIEGSMNAQLRISLPFLYRNLVELEVKKDFTMVYQDTPGFRAGTCTPFLFYDLDYEIKTPLIIHPIAFASSSLATKHASQRETIINSYKTAIQKVNGTFSILFSNTDFIDTKENAIWRSLFSEKYINE